MSQNQNGKRTNRMHVIEPEVMDKPASFADQGNFPTLRNSLKDSLGESYARCGDAAEELKKIMRAQAELMETAVRDAKRAYERTREELRETGV